MNKLLAGSFALLLLSGTTWAQQAPASGMESTRIKSFLRAPQLTGRLGAAVVDSAGAPVQGALIRAVHMKTNSAHYATTDVEGRFALENLQAGDYRVKITQLDYEPLEVSRLSVGFWRATPNRFILASKPNWCGTRDERSGVLLGKVQDSMGTRIPGAEVRAVHAVTELVHSAVTNHEGVFKLEDLVYGYYSVRITSPGFRPLGSRTWVDRDGATQREFILEAAPPAWTEDHSLGMQEPKPSSTIKNFFRVNEQICTGGQPTMEELEKLKAEGVKAIINLRMPTEYDAEEEAAKAKALGLRYFHIPFNNNDPKDEAVDEFLKVMADKQNLPIFIHCTTANRVGGFWLIRRVLVDGWTVEQAEEEAKKIGLRNEKTREFALSYISRHQKSAGS